MESNQLKTLNVDWLGNCPTCDREEHVVSTSEGNKDYLYEDDAVKCWCGQTGVIETDGEGHAWCNWDDKDKIGCCIKINDQSLFLVLGLFLHDHH